MTDKKIIQGKHEDREIEIVFSDELETEDERMAFIYYHLSLEKFTEDQIAEYFKVSRSTLWKWRNRWRSEGTMQKAQRIALKPKYELARIAQERVLDSWPDIVDHAVKIAKGEISVPATVRAWAIQWLKSEIIDPAMAENEPPGANELRYAKNKPTDFSPTVIQAPAFLKKTSP